MKEKKLCKTVHQYNKMPILKEDMDKLLEIAKDYQAVKNCHINIKINAAKNAKNRGIKSNDFDKS